MSNFREMVNEVRSCVPGNNIKILFMHDENRPISTQRDLVTETVGYLKFAGSLEPEEKLPN